LPTPIDTLIDQCPDPEVRERLCNIQSLLRTLLPQAKEGIAYNLATFSLPPIKAKGSATHLIHFAPFKNHIGLYPTPSGIVAFATELAAYPQGKGSVQFPHNQPLPLELIGRIAQFRLDAVLAQRNTPTAS